MLGISSGLMYPSYLREDTTYSLLVDGAGDYLDTNASFQSTFRGSFSIACWVQVPDGSGSNQVVFGSQLYAVDGGIILKGGIQLLMSSLGIFQFNFEGTNGSSGNPVQDTDLVPAFADGPTPWRHIVCVMSQSAGSDNSIASIYVNGVYANATSGDTMTKAFHQGMEFSDLYIAGYHRLGVFPEAQVTPFTGKIDEFAIWDEALDSDSIVEIYNQRYNSSHDLTQDIGDYDNSSDLVSYYRMNEGTGSTVADSEGSNNATLAGSATFDLNSFDD
jgi:hypothetical protein